ncbi:hypothetical protein SUGI_0373590 [Cryptomeria japonica]|nr:hypothetical protein SUGI_0373590 [Cryptomeria japonica]
MLVFLLFFLSIQVSYSAHSYQSDEDALLTFKRSLILDPQNYLLDWSPNHSFCNWTGIACSSRHQRVVSFNLTERNQLTGTIPSSLGNLSSLTDLELGGNRLYGVIPNTLFNCSLLQKLSLYGNYLTGHIPWQFGNLPELQVLLLWGNQFIGEIPTSLSNCTQLQVLELELNQLSGLVPLEFGNLLQLQWLNLGGNNLVSGSSDLSILTALSNCSSLQFLSFSHNYLTGILPSSISKLSSELSYLDFSNNRIEGNIPSGIGNLTKMQVLTLSNNHFNGSIPSTLGLLLNLERLLLEENNLDGRIPESLGHAKQLGLLSLSENMISGKIPESLGGLSQLRDLLIDKNQLSGKIPAGLGRCITLEKVDLAQNKLEGNIPDDWASLTNLQFYLNISNNLLQGSISVISKMAMVQAIDVSLNNFSGEISGALSSCKNLQYLNLSRNSFNGPIPVSLTNLKNLQDIDMSCNNLSGTIPVGFKEMKMLQHINLSSNSLTGEVPEGGVFTTIDKSAILGNIGLCGKWIKLQPCSNPKHEQFLMSKKVIVPAVIGTTIFIISFILVIYYMRHSNKNVPDINIGLKRISYEELVEATNGFSHTNLVGDGSFGSVYKGTLKDGTDIAVKALNMLDENSIKGFERECNVLKRVRHRNVIKITSICSNLDFKALVLPFMSNGSLEKWLYPQGGDECTLTLSNRLKIAKEIAQGMAYLHHHCFVQVIHCDLKPNNVLLDDDFTPYIADFGITKILFGSSSDSLTSSSALKGSIGYIAPEYSMGGNVSTKGDVYSYGILILELLTRKRPTNDMFKEGINLPKWASMDFPNKIIEVVDNYLLQDVNEINISMVLACLTQCIQVGLVCTRELPQQRPNMIEIVDRLENIVDAFLGIPRAFHLPIDISPLLESTSGPKANIEDWSTSTS